MKPFRAFCSTIPPNLTIISSNFDFNSGFFGQGSVTMTFPRNFSEMGLILPRVSELMSCEQVFPYFINLKIIK